MDRGAWWAAVCGVAPSQTQLKWLSSSRVWMSIPTSQCIPPPTLPPGNHKIVFYTCDSEWNKTDKDKYHNSTHMWNLKRWYKWTYLHLWISTPFPHRMSKSVEDIQHTLTEEGRKGGKRGREDTIIILENKGQLSKGRALIHTTALRNLSSQKSI